MNCCCVIALFTTPGTGAEWAAALCIRSSIIYSYLACLYAFMPAGLLALCAPPYGLPGTRYLLPRSYIYGPKFAYRARSARFRQYPPLPSPSPQDMGNALLNNLEYPWYQGRLSITTELAIRARCHCAVLLFGLFLLCYRWQS